MRYTMYYLLTYLLTKNIFAKFGGLVTKFTQDTTAVAFPLKPV